MKTGCEIRVSTSECAALVLHLKGSISNHVAREADQDSSRLWTCGPRCIRTHGWLALAGFNIGESNEISFMGRAPCIHYARAV